MKKLWVVGAALLVAGCADSVADRAPSGPSANASIVDAAQRPVGTATFVQTRTSVRVVVMARQLPPGKHGLHIHTAGSCQGPDFASAGGHFNPTGKKHGLLNPEGIHAGDLPNLLVGPTGEGRLEYTSGMFTLWPGAWSLLRAGGTSIVIHADPDDETTDPAGGSGARIACGVIGS